MLGSIRLRASRFYVENTRWGMRPPRISTWSYGRGSIVFLTIVTHQHRPIFGRIRNGDMLLSPAGSIMHRLLQELHHHAEIEMHAFVVMPDHIHVLFTIHSRPHSKAHSRKYGDLVPGTLPVIVRSLKSAATKQIREECPELTNKTIWQRNYYESLIPKEAIESIRRYILNNPRNWKG